MSLAIRRARPGDVLAIVHLLAADAIREMDEDLSESLPQAYTDAYERIAADPKQLLVAAESDGEVVGTLQLTFIPYLMYRGGTVAQIEAVRVAAHLRGKGIGEQMVRWAIERAQEHGCVRVQLTTNKARTDAHRFYERLGFVATHEGLKLFLGS